MTGVLAAALEAREIPSNPEKLWADVEGAMEKIEGQTRLTSIRLQYHLKVPREKKAEAIRALEVHESQCPASQSLRRGISIEYSWQLQEE